jgi:integrase/recombinase XerD
MASLKQRHKNFIIQFSKREGDKIIQRSFSLGTTDKRKAERLKLQYEDKFDSGEINPFNGWSPDIERQLKQAMSDRSHMSLEQAADRFIAERSQANAVTKKGYQKMLNMMMDQLGRSMPIAKIRADDIRAMCFRSDIAVATQRSYFVHYKVFFKWLFDNEYIKNNLIKGMKPPKLEERVVQKVINESQLQRLFDIFDQHIQTNSDAGFIKHQNQKMLWFKPMINTFFYAGLRSKELIHLRWSDIQDDFKYILVTNNAEVSTKSGKSRKVPIRVPLAIVLKNWKETCQPAPSDYVFSNVNTAPGKHKMDSFRISHAFKRFVKQANLPEHC